jgi:hypothetical protein
MKYIALFVKVWINHCFIWFFLFVILLSRNKGPRLVPISGIDRENLILLYSHNRNCFIDELMSILSFLAAKHIRRIFYIALRHWLEGSEEW